MSLEESRLIGARNLDTWVVNVIYTIYTILETRLSIFFGWYYKHTMVKTQLLGYGYPTIIDNTYVGHDNSLWMCYAHPPIIVYK